MITNSLESGNMVEAGMLMQVFNEKYDNGPVKVSSKPIASKKRSRPSNLIPAPSTSAHPGHRMIKETARESRPYSLVLDEPVVASNRASTSCIDTTVAANQAAELARQQALRTSMVDNEDLMQIEPTEQQMIAS